MKEQTDSTQRGVGSGIMGKIGEGPSRDMYKGHMDKAKGGRLVQGWEAGMGGVKMEKTAPEQH